MMTIIMMMPQPVSCSCLSIDIGSFVHFTLYIVHCTNEKGSQSGNKEKGNKEKGNNKKSAGKKEQGKSREKETYNHFRWLNFIIC